MNKVMISWLVDGHDPQSVTILRLPAGCRAVVTVDDTTLGPAIGGVRMNSDVSAAEVIRLARAMTLKNAAAGLPHGGGKSGIHTPAEFARADTEQVVRAFAYAIRDMNDYVPGPDMGTDETAMAWIHDENGRAVGLPQALGGIPLDEVGATGYGLAICAQALEDTGRLHLAGSHVAIQGFGAVGRHAARFLAERGAVIVAVSDRSSAVFDPQGPWTPSTRRWPRSGTWVGTPSRHRPRSATSRRSPCSPTPAAASWDCSARPRRSSKAEPCLPP